MKLTAAQQRVVNRLGSGRYELIRVTVREKGNGRGGGRPPVARYSWYLQGDEATDHIRVNTSVADALCEHELIRSDYRVIGTATYHRFWPLTDIGRQHVNTAAADEEGRGRAE